MNKSKQTEKTMVSLQMPKELLAKLNEVADKKAISVSALVRLILLDYFYYEAKGELTNGYGKGLY